MQESRTTLRNRTALGGLCLVAGILCAVWAVNAEQLGWKFVAWLGTAILIALAGVLLDPALSPLFPPRAIKIFFGGLALVSAFMAPSSSC